MNELNTVTSLENGFNAQKQYFSDNLYPSYEQRISDLETLKQLLLDNQQAFIEAMSEDFGHRSHDDSKIGDILTTVMGIKYSIKRLKKWMKPVKKHTGMLFQPASSQVIYQPKGVIGIIAPWNYPLFLSFGPLTAALAAGNPAMIKMSEYTPKTNTLLANVLAQGFSQAQVAIVCGEVDIATAFSNLKFDHLFFTGSTSVGRIVMRAASNNLVPVTLELGGKSPSIIDDEIDIDLAVTRLILGKTLNSGQTCVAPDYLLCPKAKVEELTLALQKRYQKMYPTINDNNDSTCIISDGQKARLDSLLEDAKEKNATILPLVQEDAPANQLRKMPLTVLTNVNEEMHVMQQEIFGPLLPIIGYDNVDEAMAYINKGERPLALYIFSFDKAFQDKVLKGTHAGGVCINEAAFHVANDDLPFGGVGESGMGQYHGDEGFKTFSHAKSVMNSGKINFNSLLFPPFNKPIHKILYKMFIR
ncbi:MAG: coniferyl aldehyde dehydrogenase [Colwellia sp.]